MARYGLLQSGTNLFIYIHCQMYQNIKLYHSTFFIFLWQTARFQEARTESLNVHFCLRGLSHVTSKCVESVRSAASSLYLHVFVMLLHLKKWTWVNGLHSFFLRARMTSITTFCSTPSLPSKGLYWHWKCKPDQGEWYCTVPNHTVVWKGGIREQIKLPKIYWKLTIFQRIHEIKGMMKGTKVKKKKKRI